MKYYLVTAKGVLEQYNTHKDGNPVFGSGQGATDSPAKWTGVSNPIIKCNNKWAIGRVMEDPMKQIKKKYNNTMFVDNATLLHNLGRIFIINSTMLMVIVKYNVTLWGRYLWTAGGWFEYMKTQYNMLDWAFKQFGEPHLRKGEVLPPNTVAIKGADGSNTKLHQVEVDEGIKILGVRQAGALQQDTECTHLLGKTAKFCGKLQKALVTSLLLWMGYHHTLPQNIAFGLEYYGGIGLYLIDGEQVVGKISAIIVHIRAGMSVAEEIKIMLGWAQLCAGTW
eukprot:11898221-Ditylum_brightwellii.AAC.1